MVHVDRDSLVAYCREDPEQGDHLMELAEAAEAYLMDGGGYHPELPTFALAVKGIVLFWHDHPDGGEGFPPGLRAVVNQLKNRKGGARIGHA